ncbi:hypothetical protein [Nonomuraea wenchangensis]|uniref:hypothetical protein n=1 Tax=Nonomuraea wenchangensis TaxID=568860 RepID=UPI0033215D77
MNQRVSRSRPPSTQAGDTFKWTPYTTSGGTLRVRHTSCCGRYELASEGGQFFVLRQAESGGYEETGRGRTHRGAVRTYVALVIEHRREHVARGEPLEPDPYVDEAEGVPDPLGCPPTAIIDQLPITTKDEGTYP